MSEVSNKRFVHFDGTKEDFQAGNYPATYTDSIVFINGDGDENSNCIYTHNEIYSEKLISKGKGSCSIMLKNSDSSTNGDHSVSLGKKCKSNAAYSHAEGWETEALKTSSHSEGYKTKANANYSHTEGRETKTQGDYAHAEGRLCEANFQQSHAEGYYCVADAEGSHAEGHSTKTKGVYSHSAGMNTITYGEGSDACGYNTTTGGDYIVNETDYENMDPSWNPNPNTYGSSMMQSDLDNGNRGRWAHAEGNSTIASGPYSHAEGNCTFAYGLCAHAEGYKSIAIGNFSHAEGNKGRSIGKFSHAEGNDNWAMGSWSHTEGSATKALGTASHAEGYTTIAEGDNSHTEGDNTYATGNNSHAEGKYSYALGDNSHAEGHHTSALGTASHAEGTNVKSFGVYSHAEGFKTEAGCGDLGADYLDISEKIYELYNQRVSDFEARKIELLNENSEYTTYDIENLSENESTDDVGSQHAEGLHTIALNSYSHAEGSSSWALGLRSHSEGWMTTAKGEYSHAEGIKTFAIGNGSHAEGGTNYAIGDRCHVGGIGNTSHGLASFVHGQENTVKNDNSIVFGISHNVEYDDPAEYNSVFVCGCYSDFSNFNDERKPLFVVGHGDSGFRRNALELSYDRYSNEFNLFTGVGHFDNIVANRCSIQHLEAKYDNIIPYSSNADIGSRQNMFRFGYFSNRIYASGFFEASDITKKNIISPVNVDFNKIKQIPKVNFVWKDDKDKKNNIGTIAQEMKKIYPEFVNGDDGEMTVDYAKLSIIALSAIDVLNDKIQILENKLK